MRQRLGIAGALLRDPKLLLLDEPTTGLDPGGMRDMRALVRRLADQGITVLLSSHLMGEVEDLCDRRGDRPHAARSSTRARSPSCSPPPPGATRCAPPTTSAPPRSPPIATAIADVRFADGGLTLSAAEEAATALSIALGEAGIGIAALVPAHGHARGAVLPHDRGRGAGEPAPAATPEEALR